MSVATVLPAKPTIATGGRRLTPGSLADVLSAIGAAAPGDTVVLPNLTIGKSLRMLDKHDVTIELSPSTLLTGGGAEGIYVYRCDRIRITGTGTISADDSGIGIYSGSGHVVDGQLKITRCGAMGILVNTSDGTRMDNIWIEAADVSHCGDINHSPDASDPDYWKYGLHCIYFGGGRGGSVGGVIIGNHIHDQPNGYGAQLGGQAQGVVVCSNLIERVDGASAGGPVSDRNARGVQVFSSYSDSKDVLIVSNVFRDCAGAPFGVGPNSGIQGVGRDNVAYHSGPYNYDWGTAHGLTDGGRNTVGDYATVAAALAAGKLDPAFVLGSAPPPPPPPPSTITGSIPNGATLSGSVPWTADNGPCDFSIDGQAMWHENTAPYVYGGDGNTLDTKTLADGTHTFKVALADGTSHSVVATVKNAVTPPPPTDSLPLRKIAETATTVTLAWDPIPCLGYVLYADGVRKSNSWDPAKSTWKTNKASEIRVVALGEKASGTWKP